MISQDTIQTIVNRIDIVDIIGEFVKLRRRGANYLGLCPFHDERTPSFTVSATKEIFKCFGCGKSGNTITFLMEHEKYSYVEALKWLATRYNIEIEEKESSPEYKLHQQAAESLHAINNFAQKFFEESLYDSDEGRSVGLGYLRERGFRDHVIRSFGIGYCPSGDTFSKAAIDHQFNKDLLLKSGLVTSREGNLRDNYRERIIFPVHNQTGKVIGFGARLIAKNDKAPKYINTPENEIYIKSKILYGLWQARQSIGKKDECILVEGYTDVVSLHQAGIENVVASGGTSLTHDQLRLIKKITPHLTILYDGDAAGIAAAMRGLDLALEEGLTVKIVVLPEPEDPDSYIKKFGATAFEDYLKDNKKDFIIFQLDWAIKDAGSDSARKAAAVQKIAESLSKLNRPEEFTLRQDYVRKVSERLEIEETGLLNLINSILRENIEKQQKRYQEGKASEQQISHEGQLPESSKEEDLSALDLLRKQNFNERGLVRCLLEYGLKSWDENVTVADYLLGECNIEEFISDDLLRKILNDYRYLYESNQQPTTKFFIYNENQQVANTVVSLIAFPYEVSRGWIEKYNQEVPAKEDKYIDDISSTLRYAELRKVRALIIENEKELQKDQTAQQLTILIGTHQHLKTLERDLASKVGMVIRK